MNLIWYDENPEDTKRNVQSLIRLWKRDFLNEWSNDEEDSRFVYILASNYQIALSIYRRLYPEKRTIDLRYIRDENTIRGTRGIEVIVSSEKYPHSSFYERLEMLKFHEHISRIRIVYEQDIQKESKEGDSLSGQRQETSESK